MGCKINIEKLLKNYDSKNIIYNTSRDTVEDNLGLLLKSEAKEDIIYIGADCFFTNCIKEYLDSKWYIKSIFCLGFPFNYSLVSDVNRDPIEFLKTFEQHPNLRISQQLLYSQWYLCVFTQTPTQKIIFGFNNNEYLLYQYSELLDNSANTFAIKDEMLFRPVYNKEKRYYDYYKTIQKIIEKGEIPERRKEFDKAIGTDFEFSEIPVENFYLNRLPVLYRYKNSVVKDFGIPSLDEKLVPLNLVAEFLNPETGNYYSVKKNDIIINYIHINGFEKKYFINAWITEKDINKIEASAVIRSKDISPDYILVYLESEFVKDYCLQNMVPRNCTDDYHKHLIQNINVKELPIFINPCIDARYFKRKVEFSKYDNIPLIRKIKKASDINFYNKDAKKIILQDMKELRQCFNNGLYKSAIIMAGSILEAFLIDWLSEIKGVNYFEKKYMVYNKYLKRKRPASLYNYIAEISKINRPYWHEAEEKATEIRNKRNLVHAKLYINESDISKETCVQIIDYLEFVINTRWNLNSDE